MREAAPDAKQDHVSGLRRLHAMRPREQEAQIAFVVAMQHPVSDVRTRIERRHEAEIAEDPDEDHRAIDADVLEVGGVVIGSSRPRARFGDHARAILSLVHTVLDNSPRLPSWT